jgi:hypothetical protein
LRGDSQTVKMKFPENAPHSSLSRLIFLFLHSSSFLSIVPTTKQLKIKERKSGTIKALENVPLLIPRKSPNGCAIIFCPRAIQKSRQD